jgi:membrane associated rhomboid family serine protease
MIPLRDRNPTRSFPLITILLIISNIAVFIYEISLPETKLKDFIFVYGAVPEEIVNMKDFPPKNPIPIPLTLFTCMFLHGGILHLLGNMLYLWIFGNNVEDALGKIKFILFYILCGISASLTHIIMNPSSDVPMIGASGAISGVLGAYMILYPFARVDTLIPFFFFWRIVPIPAFFFILIWFLMQIAGASQMSGNIAWFAHIGGFAGGMVLLFIIGKKRKKRRIYLT